MSEVINFLNGKLSHKINRDRITNILDFALLWNLFELKFFDKYFTITRIDSFIENHSNNINPDILEKTYNYFKERYFENWNFSNNFNNLCNDEKSKDFIFNSFTNNKNKIKTVILIIARLRNNLFHGEKDVRNLEAQEENFWIANKFLMELLKDIK